LNDAEGIYLTETSPQPMIEMRLAKGVNVSQTFVLEYWQEDDWYVGRLRGVPGVFSQGKTLPELEENIQDAYRMMIDDEEAAPNGAQTKPVVVDV
jgi:predicted RNase H-like HicB family nuclease